MLELAHQIIRLYSFNDMEKGIYFNVAPISGGRPNGVVAGEAWGEFCVAGLPSRGDFQMVETQLASLEQQVHVDGCQVRASWRTLFPAMERTPGSGRLYDCVKKAADRLGMKACEGEDPSATDGAWLSSYGIPVVDALSAVAEEIHTVEEHVSISSIQERTALCAMAVHTICREFRP